MLWAASRQTLVGGDVGIATSLVMLRISAIVNREMRVVLEGVGTYQKAEVAVQFVTVWITGRMNVQRDSQIEIRRLEQGGGEVTTPTREVEDQVEGKVGVGEQLPVLKLAVIHLEH